MPSLRSGSGPRARVPLPRARTVLQSSAVLVYGVVDDAISPDFPLGDALEVFVCREDAGRFVEEVPGDDPAPRATCESRSASRSHLSS
jgi:hypothetical protein